MYLRLEGLSESLNNNLPHQVTQTLSKTGVICEMSDIDFVKRIGKYKESTTRPVLIRFLKEGKRNSVLYSRANLNKNRPRGEPLLWLNDDISDETRRNRKTVRDIAALAKQVGTEVKVHDDGIIVGNNKYKHADLDLLPPEISVTKAKSREEPTGIYFQSEMSPYSNHYQSRFTDDQGQTFESVEQAFQFRKAMAHGKSQIANKILATRNLQEIHKLAKQLPTNKKWSDSELNTMQNLVTHKLTQNSYIRNLLLASGNAEFHKATGNKKWGTGAELSSKALMNGAWEGRDLLGQVLEKVRATLKLVYPTPTPPTPLLQDRAVTTTDTIGAQSTQSSQSRSGSTSSPSRTTTERASTSQESPHASQTAGKSLPSGDSPQRTTASQKSPKPSLVTGQSPTLTGELTSPTPSTKSTYSRASSQSHSPPPTQAAIEEISRKRRSKAAPTPPPRPTDAKPDTSATQDDGIPLRGNRVARPRLAKKGKKT